MAKPKERGTPISITQIESARLDELHELWQALHRYHGAISSSPLVADEDAAWERRRALYRTWLETGEALALLAERDATPVGYAVVHLQDGPDDTFPLGARWAEIYSLSVAPAARGQGIGSLLLDAIDSHLTALGIHDLSVSAMVENEVALQLYESRGFVRREVVLYRFGTTAQP